MIATGLSKVFAYPSEFVTLPDYTKRAGQNVTIVRPCTEAEADGPEQDCEQMYVVRCSDGAELFAWESELL